MTELMEKRIIGSSHSQEIANSLLEIGSIQINVESPFTWVSGIQSPIYCDNRKINSFVSVRTQVVNAFVEIVRNNFREVEVIAGVATGGIPFGVLVADRLGLPFIYVRQEPKEYGLLRQVEGDFSKGQKVVLIEDHISTGKSSIKAVQGIRNAGLDLICLLSILTYGFEKAESRFNEDGITHTSICDLDLLLNVALKKGVISKNQMENIIQFRNDVKL